MECGADLLEWAKQNMTAGERDFFATFAFEVSDEELIEAGVLDVAAPFAEWALHPASPTPSGPDACERGALPCRRR